MSEADSDAGSLGDLVAGGLGTSGGALGPAIAPARPPALTAGARPVVVVLGMHRSGTSLLSNVLHYLGVDMADATDAVSKSNPSGFWERPELVALHEEILDAIGRPVASPLNCVPFPAGWWRDKAVLPFRARLRDYVEQHRAAALGWWGFKDPRTCRLLPLWLETFGQMGIEARFVWAIRSPAEAAASMAAKNPDRRPMSVAQAEMMWLAYNYDILRYYRMIAPTVVCHREWFDDPLRVARRLVSELDLPGFYSESEFESCIRNIVQRSYWRQRDADLPAPALPLSQWIYSDVASRRLDAEGDLVESHVANLEMMFQSIEPFVESLDELPKLRDSVRDAEQQAAEWKQKDADRDAELAARDQRLRVLEDELAAARRDAEAAARERAEQEALASRRSAEIDAAVEALRRAQADHEAALASREQRIRLLEDEVAEARRNADVGSQALRERHRGELQRLESELDRLRALDATLKESEGQRHELEIACDGYLARIEALKAGSAGRR